jgi:hypothetical protein
VEKPTNIKESETKNSISNSPAAHVRITGEVAHRAKGQRVRRHSDSAPQWLAKNFQLWHSRKAGQEGLSCHEVPEHSWVGGEPAGRLQILVIV